MPSLDCVHRFPCICWVLQYSNDIVFVEEQMLCIKYVFDSIQVCLYFYNKLYRGNRTTKVDTESFNAFASPNLTPLATAEVGITSKPVWCNGSVFMWKINVTFLICFLHLFFKSTGIRCGGQTPQQSFKSALSWTGTWACSGCSQGSPLLL